MKKTTSLLLAAGASALALTALFAPVASATVLYNDPADAITATNSQIQDGRISRNGIQQTWAPDISGEPAYPGSINPNSAYNYVEYTFTPAQIGDGQFVQIDFSETSAADLFASAWTSFNGTSSIASGAGWLGDAGGSEDYAFGSIPPTPRDPRYFNVTVPVGDSLTVVVNSTNVAAIGEGFGLEVEDFSTTDYTKATPSAVPEPSTWAMLGAGLLLGGLAMSRRRMA